MKARERIEFEMVQRHWEGSREFVESASRREASLPARRAKGRPSSRLRLHMIGRMIALVVIAVAMLAAPTTSSAEVSVGISVSFGPPALPFYEQPPCPAPDFIWVPGYWAWSPEFGYFWVPGTWVMAPFPGALWTPGYWAYAGDGLYVWNEGYWGPVVGYYGGIFYGFGYTGYGYAGGYWNGGQFYYNRSVNNIRTTNITNVYERTVVNNVNITRVSYNGGPNGTTAQPTAEQRAAENERRSGPVPQQIQQIQAAQSEPKLRATLNKGRPEVAATARPGDFSGREVVRASRAGAPYVPPEPRAEKPNRSGGRSEPWGNASPGGSPGKAPEARPPQTYERPERGELPPPAPIEPPGRKPDRGGAAQEPPQLRRVEPPQEKHPPAPSAKESRPEKQSHPPEKRGDEDQGHKPDKSRE